MTVLAPDRPSAAAGTGRPLTLVAGRLAAAGVSAVWMVVAARLLGLEEVADLILASALAAIAVQVADAGVGIQLPQAVAAAAAADGGWPVTALRQAVMRRLLAAGAMAPVLAAAFVATAADGSLLVAAGFAVSVVATALSGLGYVALRATGDYRVETVLEPAGRVLVLGLGGLLAAAGWGLAGLAWVYALADLAVLAAVAAVVLARSRGSSAGPALAPATWLLAAGPAGMVYWRADIWVLAALAAADQVAFYGSSYRLLDAALLPALVVAQLFPAPFARCPNPARRALLARWALGAAALLVPFSLGALAFAEPALTLLFGPEYAAAAPALRVLALAAPLTAAVFVLTAAVAALDPRAYLVAVGWAMLGNVGGNLLLTPWLGATGAAAMTVASQAGLAIALWSLARRRLPLR